MSISSAISVSWVATGTERGRPGAVGNGDRPYSTASIDFPPSVSGPIGSIRNRGSLTIGTIRPIVPLGVV